MKSSTQLIDAKILYFYIVILAIIILLSAILIWLIVIAKQLYKVRVSSLKSEIYTEQILFKKTQESFFRDLWDGPAPTIDDRRKVWNWMIEYFQDYPESDLKEKYPHLHQVAMATKRYKELELLKDRGQIDEIDYHIELEKVLPLINISDDLNPEYDPSKE